MQRDLEKLLEEVEEGQGLKIPDDLRRIASRINSQERYTVDIGEKGRLHLGENFERNADEIGQPMGFVLQAVDYGYREEVEIEKLTLPISAARHPVQVRCWLHIIVGEGVQCAQCVGVHMLLPRLADDSTLFNADITLGPGPEDNRHQIKNRRQWDPCSIRTCPALGSLCSHGGHRASCHQQESLGREKRVRLGRCGGSHHTVWVGDHLP